ncbi:uncharacterized protein LOC109836585 [Asparagus officinalis]|uniref:uncharacterized protein LOC109836585 n=1 Tax=Asparagus officinalis TaxID=4686 RepID=UPI00098E6986|nr:uncharacterized protein LOC109836585 [Asparagus officinalis]
MLLNVGMSECKGMDSPMDDKIKLLSTHGELLEDTEEYMRLVWKLNYLTVMRLDIAYSVSVVSQFLSAPSKSHVEVVKRILWYLKKTPGKGVIYSNSNHTRIAGFLDANWVGSHKDRWSIIGYCMFLGGNLISWKSKKQSVVSRSTTEFEYRAMANLICELIRVSDILTEIGYPLECPMSLYGDNKATIYIAAKPVFHERTKHK